MDGIVTPCPPLPMRMDKKGEEQREGGRNGGEGFGAAVEGCRWNDESE